MELEAILLTSLNQTAASWARKLIDKGEVSSSKSWSGPSATAENSYVNTNGWSEYGKWFLGRREDQNEETKARYAFPFTDDFRTISLNGLRAIRTRAAQNDDSEVFESAGKLLASAKEKVEANAVRSWTFGQASSLVDAKRGILHDVTLVEVGEARGHGILVTELTLLGAVRKLADKSLPAYITHKDAMGDRLTTEVGYFSGFYLAGKTALKARTFTAFESFKKYQQETYERLFEMAMTLPDNFGISLVFEASLSWETPEGSVPYVSMAEKPDDSLYEWPTVEMTAIQSADFVDNPAATSSLFTEPETKPTIQKMNTPELVELTTAASDELERRRAEENAAEAKEQSKTTAAKKKTRKKKLSEDDVEVAEEALEGSEVMAQQEVIDDLETRLTTQASKIDELIAEVEKLRTFMDGAEIIEEDAAPEILEEVAPTQLKAEAVAKVMEANPKFNRSQALLEVGKRHPEFFAMDTTTNLIN